MKDRYERKIDYLRVSITDRCNLRCVYCMPEDGVAMTTHTEILTYDEIYRICRIMADLGISKIKITGGEPLVRRDVDILIKQLKDLEGIEKVTLTTNGVELPRMMDALAEAGLDSVNISLDCADRSVFEKITRRDLYDKVLEGIRAVQKYPDVALKINCVPLGMEEQHPEDVVRFAKDTPIHVRYIERMPIGCGSEKSEVPEEEIRRMIEEKYGALTPTHAKLGNGPCRYYRLEGYEGKIGFISAISHKFCGECNRVRLTAEGFLKTCLQYNDGCDLKKLMRGGASDEEIKAAILEAIDNKPRAHSFEETGGNTDQKSARLMSQIGG